MMQELLGGGNNVNTIGVELSKLISSSSPSVSPSSSTVTATIATPTTTPQNLRCPRCDSANTKFCYYNNYNLTQPRHFCKTCRRYWTKGGALRNVPIGGGCRKNRSNITSAVGKSNSAGKMKSVSQEMSKLGLLGFDQTEFPQNPILYPSSHHTSHLLSILRGNQNQNQNPNPNHLSGSSILSSGSFMRSGMGLDTLDPIPSIGLPNSFYRNEGVLLGEVETNGLHELYQRLRSSTSCYPDHGPVILGNISSSSAANSGILDSAPVGAGFWNPNPWSTDLPTTHGAFP